MKTDSSDLGRTRFSIIVNNQGFSGDYFTLHLCHYKDLFVFRIMSLFISECERILCLL